MGEPKFTKGKWSVGIGKLEGGVVDEQDELICDPSGGRFEEEAKANASLIAAAPEMYDNEKSNMALLKVLREFIKSMMQEPHFIPLLDSLTTFIDKIDERMVASEQTLKKARGEE